MSASNLIAVRVLSATPVAQDIVQLQFSRRDGQPFPPFAAGAHIDLHLGAGLVRQYSLCGATDDLSTYTVAVKLDAKSRGGSRTVHEQLQAGTELDISAPRNNFPLDLQAPHSVLVAGGIGITPLLCMARSLLRAGGGFQLHYFCRSMEQVAFHDLLTSRGFGDKTQLHIGQDHEATAARLRRALASPPPGAQLYLCGPRAFMDLVCEIAAELGWPKASVRLEHFSADPQAVRPPSGEVRLELARTGITLAVPAGTTIVDALRAAGVAVETSCEQGVCGTCVTRVLGGTPEHHDLFLTDDEKSRGDCMALCVSRALTPQLVLDL